MITQRSDNYYTITKEDFLREMDQPRQPVDDPAIRGTDGATGGSFLGEEDFRDQPDATFEAPFSPFADPAADERKKRQAKYTAKFVVNVIDTGFSNVARMISKSDGSYQASPSEKTDLSEVWADYLETQGGDIPPGVLLMMTILVVYVPKLIQAMSDRKAAIRQKQTLEKDAESKAA